MPTPSQALTYDAQRLPSDCPAWWAASAVAGGRGGYSGDDRDVARVFTFLLTGYQLQASCCGWLTLCRRRGCER